MTQNKTYDKNRSFRLHFAGFLLASTLSLATASATAADQYQYKVLFNPSEAVLLAEAEGSIMIYDSIENEIVERAMTQQFGRIENMMFVRTRYVSEDGTIEVEEDGCD